ncbi:MAG: spherulation-specific family 4 protein [Acidimicrobiia bacterium]
MPYRKRAPHLARVRMARFAVIVAVLLAAPTVVAAAGPAFALGNSATPVVSAIWPRSGPVSGGTSLTVVGSGFTGATAVTVAGVAASSFSVASDTVLLVTAGASPTGSAITGAVAVSTPGEISAATALNTFAYRTGGTSIMVPSYIYPGAAWSQIDAGHPPVDLAIINPNSGPGTAADPNYASQVTASQGAGVDVVGYVHTSYGSRSLSTVEQEISEYETWYHVNGIFVDEASTSCSTEVSYYAPLYAYIHTQPGLDLTILNPGEATNQCYMAAADVILGFEGSPADLADAGPLPSWTADFAPGRFWGVVYDASGASLPSTLTALADDGFGEVYVTDQNLPNPYGALPTYWSQELTDASGTGAASTPVPQAVTFTTTAPATAAVGATYSVAATGGPSGQPVVLSIDPTSGSACTLSRRSNTVTFASVGTCVIDANQAGNAGYAPAPQVQQEITVTSNSSTPAPQMVPFTTTAPATAAVGATYPVAATGGPSGQPVVLSIDPTSGSSCTLSHGTVTFAAVGTCIIDANQAGTATYAPAAQIQQVITVTSASSSSAPAITSPSSYTVPANQSFSFVVSATGSPAPTIQISGNLPNGVTISGGADGTATISGASRRSRTYRLSITASNATGRTASQNFTLVIS